jgi:hypothetical protein
LLEQQNTGKYEITLNRPPAIEDIRKTGFIDKAEQLDANSFMVNISTTADELAALAVNNNWGITRLVQHEHTLEQIFVNLTLSDGDIS